MTNSPLTAVDTDDIYEQICKILFHNRSWEELVRDANTREWETDIRDIEVVEDLVALIGTIAEQIIGEGLDLYEWRALPNEAAITAHLQAAEKKGWSDGYHAGWNAYNESPYNPQADPAVPDELREQVTDIIDEAVSDLADSILCGEASDYAGNVPYQHTDKLLALFTQYVVKELKSITEAPAGTQCCDTHHQLVNRINELTATPHEEKTNG